MREIVTLIIVLIGISVLSGCASNDKLVVWEKKCYPTSSYPYEKCVEYTK
jgi:hypothetical protein